MVVVCEHCSKTYTLKINLKKHLQVVHNIKVPDSAASFNGVVCKHCKKRFTYQSNLNKHLRDVHRCRERNIISYEFSVYINKCLECQSSFINIKQLREHLTKVHQKKFVEEDIVFNSTKEFKMWLVELCQNERVQYVAQKTKKTTELDTVYYYCNRSGPTRSSLCSNATRKRKIKTQGSCKTGNACTSTIFVKKQNSSGMCSVKYVASHYGHSTEIQHLRLAPPVRTDIAKKLIEGVSTSKILDSYRKNISCDDLQRPDLLTKLDITNIKNAHNIRIDDGVRHPVDSVSVELWVEEYKQSSKNSIFYKKQGDSHDFFNKNDFCLIFMNATQEYMLKTFGNGGVVCVDSTHGLNGYDFELTTILVIDEWGEGFPAACMFTRYPSF